jgi:hypothetical protein
MLLDVVNVCAAAKKQKKLEFSVGIVMHDGLKCGKKKDPSTRPLRLYYKVLA